MYTRSRHLVYIDGVVGSGRSRSIWTPTRLRETRSRSSRESWPRSRPGASPSRGTGRSSISIPPGRPWAAASAARSWSPAWTAPCWSCRPDACSPLAGAPDGRRIAYHGGEPGDEGDEDDIYIYDIESQNAPTRLTNRGTNREPVFSPDGSRIVFASIREGTEDWDLFIRNLTDDAPPSLLISLPGPQTSWRGAGNVDLQTLSMDSAGAEPRTYLGADYPEEDARISPDGNPARLRVVGDGPIGGVRPGVPGVGRQGQVSPGGGWDPRWSPEGDELYFWRADSLFAVPFRREPDFVPGRAEPVLTGDDITFNWDVHPDGRFLLVQELGTETEEADEDAPEPRYLVVLNWFMELRERLGEDN